MKKEKTKIAFFTVPEYEKEQEWLHKEHQAGWKLIGITLPCFYRFEECEPEDVVYQLDYNQEGMKHKGEYIQMFHDCGWEYITDMAGYAYFRKPVLQMKEKEEIFYDDDSKMDMIKRIFTGRMIPLIIIFFLVVIPQLQKQSYLSTSVNRMVLVLLVLVTILYISVFVKFSIQYWKLKKRIER